MCKQMNASADKSHFVKYFLNTFAFVGLFGLRLPGTYQLCQGRSYAPGI